MAKQRLLLRLAFVSALVGSGGTRAFRPPGDACTISPSVARSGSNFVPLVAPAVVGRGRLSLSSSSLGMAPRFDKSSQKWIATDPEVSAVYAMGPSSRSAILARVRRLMCQKIDFVSVVRASISTVH